MSKPKKTRQKTDTKGAEMAAKKKTQTLAIVMLVILAIAAVGVYLLFMTGPGSSPAVTPGITGTGAAAVINDSVSVYYTGMFTNGTVFDSNVNETPFNFTIGSRQAIPGFENAVIGMKAGQTKTVTIPVEQAYGLYDPEYIYVIERTGALATANLTLGGMLTYRDPATGTMSAVRILDFTEDMVTIDANSPLAGQDLVFTIQLVSINNDTG